VVAVHAVEKSGIFSSHYLFCENILYQVRGIGMVCARLVPQIY
jgi:hypothetical protein